MTGIDTKTLVHDSHVERAPRSGRSPRSRWRRRTSSRDGLPRCLIRVQRSAPWRSDVITTRSPGLGACRTRSLPAAAPDRPGDRADRDGSSGLGAKGLLAWLRQLPLVRLRLAPLVSRRTVVHLSFTCRFRLGVGCSSSVHYVLSVPLLTGPMAGWGVLMDISLIIVAVVVTRWPSTTSTASTTRPTPSPPWSRTGVLPIRTAILLAAALNFVGAPPRAPPSRSTIGKGLVDPTRVTHASSSPG